MRQSGILMHISSLPGPDGVGSLGKEAFEFADFLRDAGMTIWQVLPMGPTGYGESPYQSTSVYAGNPFYDRTFCIDKLELENAVIDLPLYGTGSFADLRSGRWNSGITVKFLDDSAPTMTLHIDQGARAEIKDENECMYCHRVHTGFFGNIVAFFHRLFFVIRSFFGG